MTVKKHCEQNNITVSALIKMWDKKKFKTFDSYMKSEYIWKPCFNVGDIVINNDDNTPGAVTPFAVIEINSRLEEYVICWLSDDLFINDKFDPTSNDNYEVQYGDYLESFTELKLGTLDPKLLKKLKAAYRKLKKSKKDIV